MTVQELAQRLARWTSSKSYSQMTVEDRLVLLDCINSAVFNWYIAAPERMRMTSVSHLLRGQEQGSITTVAGSNDLTGLVLSDYHLGCAIEFNTEPVINEIVSVSGTPKVLHEFRNSESTNYTVYFDTIPITDYNVNRIVGHPRVLDTGIELVRDDHMRFVGAERKGRAWRGVYGVRTTMKFGPPERYTFENTGLSNKDEARIMIRVDPIPQTVTAIQFDAVLDAPTLDLNDMEGTVELAVPDQYVLPHVLPLALGDLALSPIWDGSDANTAIQKSEATIAKIQTALTQNQGSPRNRVRTTPGW